MIHYAQSLWKQYKNLEVSDRAALGAAGSFAAGVGMASVKFGLGIFTQSVLFIVSAVYYLVLCLSRFVIVYRHQKIRQLTDAVLRLNRETSVYHRTGLFLSCIGLSYAAFSVTLIFVGSTGKYSDIVAITVATITFIKIGIAARGLILSRRERNPMDSAVRFLAFTDAMLSIVVMQNVLLVSQGISEAGRSSGIFGIVLGVCVVVAGLVMFFRRTSKTTFQAKQIER
ncbi:MAG: hypothetical protein ABF747_07650 [Bifidobacterium sp.]|uniref:Uncharacterized protein n=1 Tax=Bifidobacterium fermentum TaxID=3059035 RepID=A0AB39UJ37_9BIFI